MARESVGIAARASVSAEAKLELIAVPPRPARPKAIPGPKKKPAKAAEEKN